MVMVDWLHWCAHGQKGVIHKVQLTQQIIDQPAMHHFSRFEKANAARLVCEVNISFSHRYLGNLLLTKLVTVLASHVLGTVNPF